MAFKLLPVSPGSCPECASKHKKEEPHNKDSIYYQYAFYRQHGRWPIWADAIVHCDKQTKELWKAELIFRGAWVEPISQNQTPQCLPDGKTIGHVVVQKKG